MFTPVENCIIDDVITTLSGHLVDSYDIEASIDAIIMDEYEATTEKIDQEKIHDVIYDHFNLVGAILEEEEEEYASGSTWEKEMEEIKKRHNISNKTLRKERPPEEKGDHPDLSEYPPKFIKFLDNKFISIMGVKLRPSDILIRGYPVTLHQIYEEWQKWEN